MADPVNLRRERKRRARAGAERDAAVNRRRFGRTRAEKDHEAAEAERAAREHEGHRLAEPDLKG